MIRKIEAITTKFWTTVASFLGLMNLQLRRKHADPPCATAHTPSVERNAMLVSLTAEFEFLSNGGYRNFHNGWRPPLYFEDSPICRRKGHSNCINTGCVLMALVSEEFKSEVAPCRKIPLKQTGETLEDLYRTATNDEIEAVVQGWLLSVITGLKPQSSAGEKRVKEDAA